MTFTFWTLCLWVTQRTKRSFKHNILPQLCSSRLASHHFSHKCLKWLSWMSSDGRSCLTQLFMSCPDNFFFLQVLLVLASPSMPFQIRKNRDGEKTLKACQSKQRICSVCQLGKSIIHVIHTAKLVGRKGLSAEFPDRTPQMPHCPTNPSAKVPTPTPGSIRGDFQPCPSLTSPGMGTRNPSLTDPQLH